MNNKIIGIVVLVLFIGSGLVWWFYTNEGSNASLPFLNREIVKLSGLIGSEKNNYLNNPELKALLNNQFGLEVDFKRAGSVEQVRPEVIGEAQFLWPSSQVSLDLFRIWNPARTHKSEVIFNTPIVIFSWDKVTDALITQGVVQAKDQNYYVVDFPKLLDWVLQGKPWSEIGLAQLYGKINLISTDPTKSNSGNLFAGLLANILVGGEVAQEKDLDNVIPTIKRFFERQGFMEASTGFLFEQFLNKGMGSYPMIVGYENQLVEFSLQNPEIWERVKPRLRILYPIPTVWSSHTLITLDEAAHPLITALHSPEAQKIAWQQHGFRSGVVGVANDPKIFEQMNLLPEINAIIPLPSGEVMSKITESLSQ